MFSHISHAFKMIGFHIQHIAVISGSQISMTVIIYLQDRYNNNIILYQYIQVQIIQLFIYSNCYIIIESNNNIIKALQLFIIKLLYYYYYINNIIYMQNISWMYIVFIRLEFSDSELHTVIFNCDSIRSQHIYQQ